MTVRAAAVVLNHRTPQDALLAVGALQGSHRPIQDLLVVDNGSGDGSEAFLRQRLPGVTVLQTGANLGFSGGSNVGIREALARGAELVLLVNSDAILPPDCLGCLEAALTGDPGLGIVGPVVLGRTAPERVLSAGISYSPVTGRMRNLGAGERFERHAGPACRRVDAVSGCVMLIKRAVFDRVGLLAEEYFFSFEDLDFCLRARRAGFATACVGTVTALHEGSRSIGARSARRIYFATRNHLLVARRAAPRVHPALTLVRTASVLTLNLAHVLARADAPVLAGLAGAVRGAWHHFRRRYGDGP